MKIWDISRTLSDDLAEWPGDEPFHFRLTRKIAEGQSVNLGAIGMSVHSGTHADAEFHFDTNGESIEKAPLEIYLGRAAVVDLTQAFSQSKEKHLITVEDLIAANVPSWLQKNGVKLLGLDLPSVDEIDSKSLQNHHALAGTGIAIVESLDLSGVGPGIYNFAALPLKIAGGDGAPMRAVLWRD